MRHDLPHMELLEREFEPGESRYSEYTVTHNVSRRKKVFAHKQRKKSIIKQARPNYDFQ